MFGGGVKNRIYKEKLTLSEALKKPVNGYNTIYTLNGESKTLSEWGEKISVSRRTLAKRIRCGWSIEKALTTPLRSSYG